MRNAGSMNRTSLLAARLSKSRCGDSMCNKGEDHDDGDGDGEVLEWLCCGQG